MQLTNLLVNAICWLQMDAMQGNQSDSELCLLSQTSLSVLLDGIDSDTLEAGRGIDESCFSAGISTSAAPSNLYPSNLDTSRYSGDPMISGHPTNSSVQQPTPAASYTHLTYTQPAPHDSAVPIIANQISPSVSLNPLSVQTTQNSVPSRAADHYAQVIPSTIQQFYHADTSESRDDVVDNSPTLSCCSTSTLPSPKAMSFVNRHSTERTFAGELSFQLQFPSKTKVTKGTPWVFSRQLNKLYVQMGVVCPVTFKVSQVMEGLFVRATPFYSEYQYRDQPVHACPVHKDETKKHLYPTTCMPWMRCPDGYNAFTDQDQHSHFSVLVPWRGAERSLEMAYSFACRNTCVGGPNRKSTTVAFTLENDKGEVLAKQLIEVKVVASPGRDMCKEEAKDCGEMSKPEGKTENLLIPGKRKATGKRVTFSEQPVKKKYYLEMSARQTYDTLAPLRDSLELWHSLTPEQIRDNAMKNRHRDDTLLSPACPNTSHLPQTSRTAAYTQRLHSPDSSTSGGNQFNCSSNVDRDLKISE
ncbi:cellular tumor antigen p53-like isoform X2 [Watersipora subatra]